MPALLRASGLDARTLRLGIKDGTVTRVRRGAHVAVGPLEDDPYLRERQLALGRVAAVVAQSGEDTVVSHASAALLWGLPLLRLPDVVHVRKPVRRSGGAAGDVFRHVGAAPPDVVRHRGFVVTSLAQTVADCARTLGGPGGLVVADAALAAGAGRQDCIAIVERVPGARGIRTARAVLRVADDGAESPGESRARGLLVALGLPAPETQVMIRTLSGVFWADLGWSRWRLLIEYDGVAKYAADGPAVLLEERRRQEAIEEAGWRVLRLTSRDLAEPDAVAARIRRAVPPGGLRLLEPVPELLAPPCPDRRGAASRAREGGRAPAK